jgi:translation initiation factor IF-1
MIDWRKWGHYIRAYTILLLCQGYTIARIVTNFTFVTMCEVLKSHIGPTIIRYYYCYQSEEKIWAHTKGKVKMDIYKIRCEDVVWIHLAQNTN